MTLQASLVDLDILLAAGGAVADRLTGLGRLRGRRPPRSRACWRPPAGSRARLAGARAAGSSTCSPATRRPRRLAAGAGAEGGLEPALADVVATLKMQVGDVRPEDVHALGSGDAPMLDETTVAVGIFADDRIVAAISSPPARRPVRSRLRVRRGAVPAAPAVGRGPGLRAPGRHEPARVDARRMNLLRDVDDGRQRRAGPHPDDGAGAARPDPRDGRRAGQGGRRPVDLLVNGTLIARGEVVVIDEEFGGADLRDRLARPGNRLGA